MAREEIRVQETGEGVVIHLSGGIGKAAKPYLIEECLKAVSDCASSPECDFVHRGVLSQRCQSAATTCLR